MKPISAPWQKRKSATGDLSSDDQWDLNIQSVIQPHFLLSGISAGLQYDVDKGKGGEIHCIQTATNGAAMSRLKQTFLMSYFPCLQIIAESRLRINRRMNSLADTTAQTVKPIPKNDHEYWCKVK